jgi:hypothetical protein
LVPSHLIFHFEEIWLGGSLRDWHRIVASLQEVNLQGQRYSFVWALHPSGLFSVKSIYAALVNNGVRVSQDIWQTKLPTKIKIFLWYLKRGVTLTKDNLARRNWNGDTRCSFCYSPESIQHLFLDCFYAKFLWRAVHMLFGLHPPTSIDDLFNNWSKLGSKKHNLLLLTAAATLCWVVWLTRNEVVFENADQNLSYRFYSEELTGFVNGQACIGMRTFEIS